LVAEKKVLTLMELPGLGDTVKASAVFHHSPGPDRGGTGRRRRTSV